MYWAKIKLKFGTLECRSSTNKAATSGLGITTVQGSPPDRGASSPNAVGQKPVQSHDSQAVDMLRRACKVRFLQFPWFPQHITSDCTSTNILFMSRQRALARLLQFLYPTASRTAHIRFHLPDPITASPLPLFLWHPRGFDAF
jgi:hypothetical protein